MTAKKPRPSLEWVITESCNYNCPYCCSEGRGGHCSDETVEAVFRLISELEDEWLIKLVGGEPSTHPRFFDICSAVTGAGHKLCMTTNFSPSLSRLEKLIGISGDRLEYITASLHLGQIKKIEDFIEKAHVFNATKNRETQFTITSVVTEDNFRETKEIETQFIEKGVPFKYQVMKAGGKFVDYPEAIETYISDRLIEKTEELRGKNLFGTMCRTGQLFFKINVDGEAVRCYSNQPYFHLGNLKSNFSRFEKPKPCLAGRCTCTVPANRNMIEFGNKAPFLKTAGEYIRGLYSNMTHMITRTKSSSKTTTFF
ncbi:radical SAM protein [Thermodesulfobacteriota bacterium]